MVKLFKKSADKAFVDVSDSKIEQLVNRLNEIDPIENGEEYTKLCNEIQYIRRQREMFKTNKPKRRIHIKIGGEFLTALLGSAVAVWSTNKVLNYEKEDNIMTDTQKRVTLNNMIPKKWF